ncbi:myo-inositol-1-phosphate synthase [Phenylobacterium zucineum HLK1]|uniref:Myo-inositol-1-phosphate synthase n=1 Tax=Phenylobacterium zucineum (strain HLK1) TaxID=450851 RepID=B4RE68_PHEZH|nr:myo-inositol-1-phosphate synthase [Phenylobacterium zucineum]ACG78501.1 myo-inositol-1-phosphate synthase [Phenylobacterium zucineum HLK1]
MSRRKLRVGIVGVGNCASSFVQGLSYYGEATANEPPPGLMHVELGGYHVGDIELASAFDVHAGKVGRDLGEAALAPPNNTMVFAKPGRTGVTVERGPTLDGIGQYLAGDIEEADVPPVDVAETLKRTGTEILVSYLPVGSQRATEYYAAQALEAGCAFVNCIPVFIASDPVWAKRFEKRGVPIIGDDIKSQVGATIVHRVLANLFRERGVRIDRTYQLNFGGNSDFKNMLERERLSSKKISKTQAVTSQFDVPLDADDVHVGPSDFVPWLTDRKWAHIRVEGTTFGGAPLNVELKLEVWDSPNSAGIVIDAVRCAKLGLDRRLGGPLLGPSSYFMKSPPEQYTDNEARERTLRFIAGDDQPLPTPVVAPGAAKMRAKVQLAS